MARRTPTSSTRSVPRIRSVPRGVTQIVSLLQPVAPDAGDTYAGLAARVETFLEETAPDEGWAGLDIARFVRCEAWSQRDRIALCCNLSALVACIAGTDELTRVEAARLWDELRAACPDDHAAQEYLNLGAQQFGIG